jgi:hypothetical protein
MFTETANEVLTSLERDGIALLPQFVTDEQLRGMQTAFEARLQHVRWNDTDGYEKERFRHQLEDVLTLDQGFVDAALHPKVKETLREYLGDRYQLVEAKGWRSLPARRDFHGWHGDTWYDQTKLSYIPREVKLGIYLTDVRSGFFEYVKGSHQKQAPRPVRNKEVEGIPQSMIAQVTGAAGTGFLFDTTGIHRQSVPILERRCAVFYNYHDPSIPVHKESLDYYRYHPLLLNAAFLGNLRDADYRILGFGDKRNYLPAFSRSQKYARLQSFFEVVLTGAVVWDSEWKRILARLTRITKSVGTAGRRP